MQTKTNTTGGVKTQPLTKHNSLIKEASQIDNEYSSDIVEKARNEKRQKFYGQYKYFQRSHLAYEDTKSYLINNDISCIKYNQNNDNVFKNKDLNKVILRLSPDGEKLMINDLK